MSDWRHFSIKRREALAFCVSALAFGSAGMSFAAQQAGSVTDLAGSATASAGGKTRSLAIREAVLLGDLLRTAAEARLAVLLGERTKLRLGSQTELRIDEYIVDAGGELDFGQGTIMFDSGGKPVGGNLRFKTPYGLIAVRGTIFYAGPSNGVFGVFVRRGHVEVTAAGETVRVGPREGTDIARPGAAPTKPVIWKAKRVRGIESQVL